MLGEAYLPEDKGLVKEVTLGVHWLRKSNIFWSRSIENQIQSISSFSSLLLQYKVALVCLAIWMQQSEKTEKLIALNWLHSFWGLRGQPEKQGFSGHLTVLHPPPLLVLFSWKPKILPIYWAILIGKGLRYWILKTFEKSEVRLYLMKIWAAGLVSHYYLL